MFITRTALLTSLVFLTACSSMIEGDLQQVNFVTKNATDAQCTVTIGELSYKYKVMPPQTIWVNRSADDMNVVCNAQGGRSATTVVKSEVAPSTFTNVFNGTLGLAYDAETGSMFRYPKEVEVDFSAQVAQQAYRPSYENTDAYHPDNLGQIEYRGPRVPALAEDESLANSHRDAVSAAAKEDADAKAMEAERAARISAVEGGFYGDKGHSKTDPKPAHQQVPEKTTSGAPVLKSPTAAAVKGKATSSIETNIQSDAHIGEPIFPSTTSF